ncbi:MAG: thioester domain-containing protein [Bacilli bacterium]|nr:thioester domain-containing protein [Bacilli bacterium]
MMKKILFIITIFVCFISSVSAKELFHLGEKVPDVVIYMDRVNKQVYYQPKKIYRNSTNELVYCIQPGVVLSSGEYDSYEEFNEIFNITEKQFNRIKLIAYYGYNYKDHTDIKWYAITQYLIWMEIKPDNWVMYFSNLNHERLDDLFIDEINEINELVNNHDENINLKKGYILNNRNEITINASDDINRYKTSYGAIFNNQLVLNNLNYGQNDITLTIEDYNPVLFYYNSDGQNVFKRGDVFKKQIDLYIYVNAGKTKINECNEENFSKDFIGGTYEILNEDDLVLSTITCDTSECISNYLPIGFHKIRVKSLPDNYENNDHIYDIEIKDKEITNVDICSLPKKTAEIKREIPKIEDQEEDSNEESYEYDDINIIEEDNTDEIYMPSTKKNSFIKYILIIFILITYILSKKCDKNNI